MSIIAVFMIAGFSFQGTELVGVAAGESKDPRRDMPRAIRTVFWRIMLFYIGAIVVIGFLLPYTDPSLLASADNEDITASPFTLVFERAGIAVAASVMNAVILTAILSAGNSGLYASTRMLYAMAKEGTAPRLFARLNERGVPVMALFATAFVGLFGFLTEVMGDGAAYTWLINVSGLSGFIVWIGIAWCHFRFRRAYVHQGHDVENLPVPGAPVPDRADHRPRHAHRRRRRTEHRSRRRRPCPRSRLGVHRAADLPPRLGTPPPHHRPQIPIHQPQGRRRRRTRDHSVGLIARLPRARFWEPALLD